MHVYTYYLETTGISQAHKKKNVWEHGSENTWLGLFMQLWVRPVVGIGKAMPPNKWDTTWDCSLGREAGIKW